MDGYFEIVTNCRIVCGLRLAGGERCLRDVESELVHWACNQIIDSHAAFLPIHSSVSWCAFYWSALWSQVLFEKLIVTQKFLTFCGNHRIIIGLTGSCPKPDERQASPFHQHSPVCSTTFQVAFARRDEYIRVYQHLVPHVCYMWWWQLMMVLGRMITSSKIICGRGYSRYFQIHFDSFLSQYTLLPIGNWLPVLD